MQLYFLPPLPLPAPPPPLNISLFVIPSPCCYWRVTAGSYINRVYRALASNVLFSSVKRPAGYIYIYISLELWKYFEKYKRRGKFPKETFLKRISGIKVRMFLCFSRRWNIKGDGIKIRRSFYQFEKERVSRNDK